MYRVAAFFHTVVYITRNKNMLRFSLFIWYSQGSGFLNEKSHTYFHTIYFLINSLTGTTA